jgi:beta-lactamase class A
MKFGPKIVWGIIGAMIVVFFWGKQYYSDGALISPIGSSNPSSQSLSESFNFNDTVLAKIVERDLAGKTGEYAVVVEGLKPGSVNRFYLDDHQFFPSASLYKLFLLAAAYDQIEQGDLKEDEQITVSVSHLVDVLGSSEYGYDDIEGDKITYSVRDAMGRISSVSDNYASVMLAEKVGWDNVQKESQKLGALSTTIHDPITTSAHDVALFLRKLYAGQVVSKWSSDQIIDLLSGDQINDRIPANLPRSVKIAHKTGDLSGVRHDAGIVFLEDNPYLIVLMSKDLTYEDEGVETLAQISGDIYNYFSIQTGSIR